MIRAKMREQIFKILFRVEFTDTAEFDEQLTFAMEEIAEEFQPKDEDAAYIRDKVTAIVEKLADIDVCIEKYAEGWKLNRIGKPELTILRLAIYEMQYDEDIPAKVAINEAVELTKQFCNEDAKGFVNAVLGKIERDS